MTSLPVPEPDLASARFFEALDAGVLQILRCATCGTAHLSVLTCDICGGTEFSGVAASGSATIYSFTRVHIAHHPAFADRLPVCGGIVELDEGPRLFAPLLGEGPFAVGSRVTLELLSVENHRVAGFRSTGSQQSG